MLKPQIALVHNQQKHFISGVRLPREKFQIYEFTLTAAYLKFLDREENNPFDVTILDSSAAGPTSLLDTLATARRRHPQSLIMLTLEHADKKFIRDAFRAGAADVIEFTAEDDNLAEALASCLVNRELLRLQHEIRRAGEELLPALPVLAGALREFVPPYYLKQMRLSGDELLAELGRIERQFRTRLHLQEMLLRHPGADGARGWS